LLTRDTWLPGVHLITVAADLPGSTPTRKGESPRGYLVHVHFVQL
jgi:hypothetical protein